MRTLRIMITILVIPVFTLRGLGQQTIVEGTVHNWPTDTVYLCELPFHSPYSYSLQKFVFNKDSSFKFTVDGKEKAFSCFIAPKMKAVNKQLESLLFNNLTDEHYWGHCIKVYTYGTSTFLVEPDKGLDIELSYSSWPEKVSPEMYKKMKALGATTVGKDKILQIGHTKITFNNPDPEKHEFYQTSFNWDNQCDMALERSSSKNVMFALINLKNTRKKLLTDLEGSRGSLSPAFYDYLYAEIEFGAKKEFFKYLKYEKADYLREIIASGEIPSEIAEFIALDRSVLTETGIINEEYIEYLEFYLNFIKSLAEGEYKEYHSFDMDKLVLVSEELPPSSAYYYLANQLLHTSETEELASICGRFLEMHPDMELNEKLKGKYRIE